MGTTEDLRDAILAQSPTAEQQTAIFAEELEFLLRASPGSGKTWTSCRRFIWRGANWPHTVGGLCLLSFTNVAIKEFKTATNAVGQRDLLADPNYVGTFDSFVERYLLGPFGHLIMGTPKRPKLFAGPRPGDCGNKKLKVWVETTRNQKIPVPAWEIIPYPDGRKLRYKTSHNFGSKPVTIEGHNPVSNLLSLGYYTHAQRVFWACKLLFDRPHIADLLARRFPEIIVDEAQDCNAWLLVLLNFLRKKGAKITLVGDPDQCIFEFSMADATSLANLKVKWGIPEKPLNQSFRCNDRIAAAVRNFGSNPMFSGYGPGASKWYGPFIVRDSSDRFNHGVSAFKTLARKAGIDLNSAAIVCRGREQLESVRGKVNYGNLKGKTKAIATAAFFRDVRHDYRRAFEDVRELLLDLTGDDPIWEQIDQEPNSALSTRVDLSIWRFVKNADGLPPISQPGNQWVRSVRDRLGTLIREIGVKSEPTLGQQIKKTGLGDAQLSLPLFQAHDEIPIVRQDTIHQVKGESIDAVLVIGSAKFWNSVVRAVENGENSEERRLAYVAMTRARHLLVVALPQTHFDNHASTWQKWGFETVGN